MRTRIEMLTGKTVIEVEKKTNDWLIEHTDVNINIISIRTVLSVTLIVVTIVYTKPY